MDDGASVAKKPKLSDDEEPNAVQMGVPDSALVERILNNSDVWERIFFFMGLRERIQVEMVNKRLRSVMLALWTRETSFDAADVIKELIGDPQKKKKNKKQADRVLAMCDRIGNGLRSLKLSAVLALDRPKDLSSISNACPNIESIHFHVEVRAHAIFVPPDLRFDMFVGLKDLSFSASLKEETGYWVSAPACVFLSIPRSIERIDGLCAVCTKKRTRFETGQQLKQFFASRPSLRSIHLSGLARTGDSRKADVFRVIAQHCPLLKKVSLWNSDAIDVHGLVLLESMEEICLSRRYKSDVSLSEAELIEICERNPLIEVLALKGDMAWVQLGLAGLCAVAALRNLRELSIYFCNMQIPAVHMTKFVDELTSNSGASLRHLDLGRSCYLSTAAILVLAARCTKLRYLDFKVDEDMTPASIRHLIDSLVADSSWNPNEQKLRKREALRVEEGESQI